MSEWIEDWFGSEYYRILYRHRDSDEAKFLLDHLIAYLNIPRSARILDCGCGTGRHSLYLSRKGFEVTGIDLCQANIVEAQKTEEKNLSFLVHDIRNLFRVNYYDVALSLFTSFGYFESEMENRKMIRAISGGLKKEGTLVLDFMNIEKERASLIPESVFSCEGVQFRIKRRFEEKSIHKEIEVSKGSQKSTFTEKVRAYSQNDLIEILAANQLRVTDVFGDYSLAPFKKESPRLILVAKKH